MFSTDVCAICRDTITDQKVLPCGHVFDTDCINEWLQRSRQCPYCRAPVSSTAISNEAVIDFNREIDNILAFEEDENDEYVPSEYDENYDSDATVIEYRDDENDNVPERLSWHQPLLNESEEDDGENSSEEYQQFRLINWIHASRYSYLTEEDMVLYFTYRFPVDPEFDPVLQNFVQYQQMSPQFISEHMQSLNVGFLLLHRRDLAADIRSRLRSLYDAQ